MSSAALASDSPFRRRPSTTMAANLPPTVREKIWERSLRWKCRQPIHMKRKKALKILVVENHEDTLQAMKMYLELEGHFADTAATMKEGLAAATENTFDLVITDIG